MPSRTRNVSPELSPTSWWLILTIQSSMSWPLKSCSQLPSAADPSALLVGLSDLSPAVLWARHAAPTHIIVSAATTNMLFHNRKHMMDLLGSPRQHSQALRL